MKALNGHDESPRLLRIDRIATPIGEALLVTDDAGRLRALDWSEKEARLVRQMRQTYAPLTPAVGAAPAAMRQAFADYFAGSLEALDTIAWRAAGTPFQLAVWTALPAIRAGQTQSYGELARRLGNPKSVGADGSLTGYGGGLERKRWLLRHEAAASAADQGQLFG